jgi:diguanylate cyclase (GGDEF)-like protein/PAS domain S-box-containing protein
MTQQTVVESANKARRSTVISERVVDDNQQTLLNLEATLPNSLRHTIAMSLLKRWAAPYSAFALLFMLIFYWLVRQNMLYQQAIWRAKKVKEQALATAKLESAQRDAYHLIQSNINGVLVVDQRGIISSSNPALNNAFGYEPGELVGKQIDCLIPESLRQQHKHYVENISSLKTPRLMSRRPVLGVRKDGSSIPVEISLTPLGASDDARIAATIFDLTERYDSIAEVERLKKLDLLTQLPNRAALYEYLGQLIEQSSEQKHLLAILDLDFFKQINDSNGHDAGDQLLVEVSRRLQAFIEHNNYPAFLARICGDEFALVVRDLDHPDSINDILDALLALFDSPFYQLGNDIWLRITMGASLYPIDGNNPSILMRNADSALTNAKQNGRAKWLLYRQEFTLAVQRSQKIANELRSAIRNNELSLVYQPQINAHNNQLLGLEALVRWHNEQLGWVSPAEFVPVAESSGLMVELGQWVMREACQQGAQWQQTGFAFGKLAINVSSVEIIKGQLVDTLKTQLLNSGLNAQLLCIEITESAVMDDRRQMLHTLNELHKLGVSLSIDDFGTGMSSLARLKTLPFNHLKIDRSFVSDIPHDKDDMAICDAIINMAKSLNIGIVVEGVETDEQLEFMLSRHCHVIQGYYFYKPMTAKDLEQTFSETIY